VVRGKASDRLNLVQGQMVESRYVPSEPWRAMTAALRQRPACGTMQIEPNCSVAY
jgi:hypothetical protein